MLGCVKREDAAERGGSCDGGGVAMGKGLELVRLHP